MIIGLCGYARSGKDEAAKALVEDGFTRIGFADALRAVLYDMDPPVDPLGYGRVVPLRMYVDTYGWEMAKKRTGAREYLQDLGVAVREHVNPDAWVNAVMRKINAGDYVVPDVRFLNEVSALRGQNAVLVRIIRPGTGPINGHVSEIAIDSVRTEYTIVNDGSIEDLHAMIRGVARAKRV